ncbi:MAG TPA: ATP-binding cassette domain-containing protein [Actinomycetota bacterium]|nr:ATP-binding cassette domain-containing protein [Actinomycetota bacterium]
MDSTADPMISLREATKRYPDGTVAVHSLNMDVRRGEICVLVGPSGCGKTTTMRMINRLADPTGGQVLVGGEDVTNVDVKLLRRHIGYVIQAVGLFPHYTVRKNVGTVCALLGWDKKRIAARADELLDLVGLDPSTYGDRYPNQLSGGQRQRVGVARALAADPPVLLMDEPFGAVDPIARENLQTQFLALQSQVEKTVVLVTHDIDEAVRMGDRIAVMRQGGYLEQYATPAEILAHPASEFVADFVGRDRTLKRLSVTPLPVLTSQAEVDAALPRIPADVSLQAALTALLESPAGRVAVIGEGEPRLLTLDSIHSALRAAA